MSAEAVISTTMTIGIARLEQGDRAARDVGDGDMARLAMVSSTSAGSPYLRPCADHEIAKAPACFGFLEGGVGQRVVILARRIARPGDHAADELDACVRRQSGLRA